MLKEFFFHDAEYSAFKCGKSSGMFRILIRTFCGHKLDMPETTEAKREVLRKALEDAGLDPSVVSLKIGRGKDYIGDFLRTKKRSLKDEDSAKIWAEIRKSGVNQVEPASSQSLGSVQLLRVRGFVQAGIWQEVDGMDDFSTEPDFTAAPHPRYPVSEQFILQVRGDSMNAATPFPLPDGSYVKCVSFAAYGRDPKDRQIVVVHKFRQDGGLVEATLKRVRRFPDRIELWPESSNPRHVHIVLNHAETADFEEIQIIGVVLDVIHRIEE